MIEGKRFNHNMQINMWSLSLYKYITLNLFHLLNCCNYLQNAGLWVCKTLCVYEKKCNLRLLVVVSCVSKFQEVKVKGCSVMERFSEYKCEVKCEEL